ncbi:hypothetical protein [Xanthomarina gelatinilytica]|uniref:hypothetical protein n=1 Tax=Xanthomarina gelatinilytica TaxID=1137281 RepID=UPI003AA7E326
MATLDQFEIERKAGYFTDNETKRLSFLSHEEGNHSQNIKKWCKLASSSYEKMINDMRTYLESETAITSINSLPVELQSCINYAINNEENFSAKEFFNQAKFLKENCESNEHNPQNIINSALSECADTSIAIWRTGYFVNKRFDEKKVFKYLTFLLAGFENKDVITKINFNKFIDRPFVLNVQCITEIDTCKTRRIETSNEETSTNQSEHNCDCDELKEKHTNCNCDESTTDPCDCKCDDECIDQDPCCAIKIEPHVAELFVVKDKLSCYKPGEISFIQNVMKGETRVRKHRHLQREESYSETEEENNNYTERNTQIDERSSLSSQIEKSRDTDLSIDAGASYSSRAGGKKTYKNLSASLDVSYNQSKKDAQKIAKDQSKTVITNAIEQIQKNLRTLNSNRQINEIEEKNKHTFDGTDFDDNENGIYHFVNLEKEAQVYSYGMRQMIELYAPDPSARLKSLLAKDFGLEKPKKPCIKIIKDEKGTNERFDIEPKDYLKYVKCFGFTDLKKLGKSEQIINVKASQNLGDPEGKWEGSGMILRDDLTVNIPEGYEATEMFISSSDISYNEFLYASITISVQGGSCYYIKKQKATGTSDSRTAHLLPNLEGSQQINFQTLQVTSYSFTISFRCKLKSDKIDEWRLDVYNRIMDKYNKELEDYNKAFEEFQRTKQNKLNQNSFMLSETIKEQLKHSALEYITCQFFDSKNGMRNKVKPCGLPQMDIRKTEAFAKKVRFFEQAFEWKFMSYMLYPYFWANKCSWEDKLSEEAQNGLFQKFLQAGYARISLAIRPGYESLVNHFLSTGDIWGGSGVPPLSGPNFLPIHEEIKESKDNFNADRDGHLIWDSNFTFSSTSTPPNRPLNRNEILVKGDGKDDYYTLDNVIGSPTYGQLIFDSYKVVKDINREIIIDCIVYRIIDIIEENGEVMIVLNRNLEHKDPTLCPDDFDNRYKDKNILWSTGAKFEGAPWKFIEPTSLTWLKEEDCLPFYSVNCKENC